MNMNKFLKYNNNIYNYQMKVEKNMMLSYHYLMLIIY